MIKMLGFVLGLSLFASAAVAEAPQTTNRFWLSGAQLLEGCRGEPSFECMAYIAGVSDVSELGGFHCSNPTLMLRQIISLFIRAAEQHPENMSDSAAVTLLPVLQEALPCQH